MSDLSELRDWLLNESEELMKRSISRRDGANSTRGASEKELRSGKRMAEKMFGRKLDLVSTKECDNNLAVEIQDRIADKLEKQARQLAAWAELLSVPRKG